MALRDFPKVAIEAGMSGKQVAELLHAYADYVAGEPDVVGCMIVVMESDGVGQTWLRGRQAYIGEFGNILVETGEGLQDGETCRGIRRELSRKDH